MNLLDVFMDSGLSWRRLNNLGNQFTKYSGPISKVRECYT